MVAVCEVWAEQFYSEYFAARQPPATEWNTLGAIIFVRLARREWQKYVVGHLADDDYLTICTPKKLALLYCCPSRVRRSINIT